MIFWWFTTGTPDTKAQDYFEIPRVKIFAEADAGNLQPLKDAHFAVPVTDIVMRIRGWAFDPRENLKEFWVKYQWGTNGDVEIATWYALRKGDIRKRFMETYGISPKHIRKIVEIPR